MKECAGYGSMMQGKITPVGALIFDGMLVLKTAKFDVRFCQDRVLKETGFSIEIVIKPVE